MSLENFVKNYITLQPLARLRRNKDRAIANLLKKLHPNVEISTELLTTMISEADSMNRYWRKILSENESLRGSDYETKRIVEERAQLELGVAEMGYHTKIRV